MPCIPAKCLNSKMDFYDNFNSKCESVGQRTQKIQVTRDLNSNILYSRQYTK